MANKPEALTPEQKAYVRKQISEIRGAVRYNNRTTEKPADVIAAEKLLDKFQEKQERDQRALNAKFDLDYAKVEHALLFAPDRALAELDKLTKKYKK